MKSEVVRNSLAESTVWNTHRVASTSDNVTSKAWWSKLLMLIRSPYVCATCALQCSAWTRIKFIQPKPCFGLLTSFPRLYTTDIIRTRAHKRVQCTPNPTWQGRDWTYLGTNWSCHKTISSHRSRRRTQICRRTRERPEGASTRERITSFSQYFNANVFVKGLRLIRTNHFPITCILNFFRSWLLNELDFQLPLSIYSLRAQDSLQDFNHW